MSSNASGRKDEVLESNAGFLWLAGLFFVPAALLLFALAAQIGPAVPFGLGSIPVLVILSFEGRRPTYPFRVLQVETPPAWLTTEQRRVLSFLRSADALRSRRRVCAVLIFLTAISTGTPLLFGSTPGWVLSYLRIPSDQVFDAASAPAIVGLVFQAFATYCAQFGWGCRQAVRQWDRIQARYEPWPLNRIASAFRIVTPPDTMTEEASPVQGPPPAGPRVPLSPNMPVSGGQGLGVFSFLLGGPALFIGAIGIARDLLRSGHSFGGRVVLDLCLVIAGLALVRLGRYLWHRG